MARPPKLKRLGYEDLTGLDPEVRKGLTKFLYTLNPFLADVTNALSNRLTITENSATIVKELTFTTPKTSASPILTGYGTTPFAFGQLSFKRRCNIVSFAGYLTHRAMDLVGFTHPIFKVPVGFRPADRYLGAVGYNYAPAFMEINESTADAFLVYITNTDPSGHIDLSGSYFTNDDSPAFGAPFPLIIDVSSLADKPIKVEVLSIEDLSSKTAKFTQPPVLGWTVATEQGRRVVKIHRADGLIDFRKYKMTVACSL